ncbi:MULTISPECIES: class I SAM-dependent methyltransferase [unclassified Streptomyces]|uniref:class I SAM-dependent methyltransferase n=1 Tax=unclassified Streptomyces TaxID=2593676 RepID=UPI0033B2F1F2
MIIAPSMAPALPDWDLLYQRGAFNPSLSRRELFQLQDHADTTAGQVAVDVGTGLGTLAYMLARRGLHVTGYDASPTAIERARHLYAERCTARYEVHDFNLDTIPRQLAPGGIDLIVCRHVLPFLDKPRFLTDVRRWLHRDGVLHVTTAVTEKLPAGSKIHALPEAAVKELARGWGSCERYDLDPTGTVTALVLRGPYG